MDKTPPREVFSMLTFKIFGTPVKAKWPVFINIVLLWGITTWLGCDGIPAADCWRGW